jgi:hypothetical protein
LCARNVVLCARDVVLCARDRLCFFMKRKQSVLQEKTVIMIE